VTVSADTSGTKNEKTGSPSAFDPHLLKAIDNAIEEKKKFTSELDDDVLGDIR
jgi:hypothetical protein